MRVYEILDANGNVVGHQEMPDSLAPALLSGQTARLKVIDPVVPKENAALVAQE